MTTPTPAAVRAAIRYSRGFDDCLAADEQHALSHEERSTDEILADHIRAVAAEMRKESEEWYAASMKHGGNQAMTDHANDIEKFADRLEGRES